MAKKVTGTPKPQRLPIEKRTSIGRDHKPKNKHARKNWKPYRGQGRV